MNGKICPDCGHDNEPGKELCDRCEGLLTEKQKEIPGTVENPFLLMIISALLLIAVIFFACRHLITRQTAELNADLCKTNMIMLEKGLEMYDRETSSGHAPGVVCKEDSSEPVSKYSSILNSGRYTEWCPLCPTVQDLSAYLVEKTGDGYIRARCTFHGTVSAPVNGHP